MRVSAGEMSMGRWLEPMPGCVPEGDSGGGNPLGGRDLQLETTQVSKLRFGVSKGILSVKNYAPN